jgi:hypothetical protein
MRFRASFLCRLAFLWKYGGLYMDLDLLVLQPFEETEDNFVGMQYSSVTDGINTAVMKFDHGHPFLTNWIYEVPSKYREDDRSCIGPSLVTPMLMHYCQGEEEYEINNYIFANMCLRDQETFPPPVRGWKSWWGRTVTTTCTCSDLKRSTQWRGQTGSPCSK